MERSEAVEAKAVEAEDPRWWGNANVTMRRRQSVVMLSTDRDPRPAEKHLLMDNGACQRWNGDGVRSVGKCFQRGNPTIEIKKRNKSRLAVPLLGFGIIKGPRCSFLEHFPSSNLKK